MDFINMIFTETLRSFDFGFVFSVNILTYVIIKLWDELNGDKPVKRWYKRGVLVGCIIIVGVLYLLFGGVDNKLMLNSAILCPVFWRWIGKPIVKRLGCDYKSDVVA